MRAVTFLWIFFAAAAGIGVLLLKHNVESMEVQLQAYNDAIMADQRAVHVLKAEWSYLNDPVRLRRLAETHLNLAPMRPDQVTTFADLPEAPPGQDPKADGTVAPRHPPQQTAMTKVNQIQTNQIRPPQGGIGAFIDQLEVPQ